MSRMKQVFSKVVLNSETESRMVVTRGWGGGLGMDISVLWVEFQLGKVK